MENYTPAISTAPRLSKLGKLVSDISGSRGINQGNSVTHPNDPAKYPSAFPEIVRAVALEMLEVPWAESDDKKAQALRSKFYTFRDLLATKGGEWKDLATMAKSIMVKHIAGVGLIFVPVDSTVLAQSLSAAVDEARNEKLRHAASIQPGGD